MINRKQLIKKYIDFFKSKNHKEIPNSSLVPENDPTVLFTTAGMHPLVPFLLGEKHALGKRLCNVQRCIRTGDIDCVGDETHHTFFEMLGNWSLGDYFKKEAIEMSFEFLTKVLKLPIEKLAVSVFGGDKREPQVLKDEEAAKIWMSLGISKHRIYFFEGGIYESKNNWWGPAGLTGPCGPDTEMFYWKSNNIPAPKKFNPDDENWVEIWNDVLMGFVKDEKGNYNEASQKNIDTGMGLERTLAVLNGFDDNYLSEVWKPIIEKILELYPYKSEGLFLYNNVNEDIKKAIRIIADHIKASVFIIADGVLPSNTEQGYVLRRLIRRAIVQGRKLKIKNFVSKVAEPVFEIYDDYENLQKKKKKILEELEKEENKFLETLERGINIFKRELYNLELFKPDFLTGKNAKAGNIWFSGKKAFLLYQSYGFPIEMTRELLQEEILKRCNELGIHSFIADVNMVEFEKEFAKHQELSRTASAGKFKSGLADNSEATTKLHTAAHLLNQALREVLGNKNIYQKGSNITSERIRFDFNFDRKLTEDEIKKIENWVNDKIKKNLSVVCEEKTLDEAKKSGAQGVFDSKYGEKVKVYFIGEKGKEVSKEICAGPHVSHLGELGKFKITKEESSSAGVRRIRAVLE